MFRLLLIIFLIAFVTLATFWQKRVSVAEKILYTGLNVPVTIGSLTLSPKTIEIKNLSLGSAFYAEKVTVRINLFEWVKGKVTLEQVAIENAVARIELYDFSGSENNWKKLLEALSQASGSPFCVSNLRIDHLCYQAMREDGTRIPIEAAAALSFENLGVKRELNLAGISRIVFEVVLSGVSHRGYLDGILDEVVRCPESWFEGVRIAMDERQGKKCKPCETSERTRECLRELFGE